MPQPMPGPMPKKKLKKDGQLVIRIAKEERDRFIALCDEMDSSAAREIRLFIRDFVARHGPEQR